MKSLCGRRRAWIPTLVCALVLMTAGAARPADPEGQAGPDIVAVSILHDGRAVLIATPGIPSGGHLWRFRSFDISALPQPIRRASLSASGTKLFLQPAGSGGVVIDLTRQHRVGAALQYVDPERDVAFAGNPRGQNHYLPAQRFVGAREGAVSVVDDKGAAVPEYSTFTAVNGAVSDDGALLVVRSDGTVAICGEGTSSRAACRDLPARVDPVAVRISARSVPPRGDASPGRFRLITGTEDRAYVIDPEQRPSEGGAMPFTEAALRACLALHEMSMPDSQVKALADALPSEAAKTAAASNQRVGGWQFFRVTPDEELYAPVLEFNRRETVFPAGFGLLEQLRGQMSEDGQPVSHDALYDRYVRLDLKDRQKFCTLHVRTHSTPGTWVIEYWIYYPFDVGGLGAHLHDPEHFFVEVDKLGGSVRRVIGAAHGYMSGNNIYFTDNPGALPIDLPLFAIPELGKHATAPDIDRDGLFTPGVDENEYGERAKIWGVRDVIGTINNQFLAYDTTMSVPRRPQDCLAPKSLATRFPPVEGFADARAWCRVERVPDDGPPPRACDEPTTECAKGEVISHPDYRDVSTVLKSWFFPDSFLRFTYGYGPSVTRHTVALGYALDLDRLQGLRKIMPLPGRVGAEVFGWSQDPAYLNEHDKGVCIGLDRNDPDAVCTKRTGWGWGLRYEQFISNIFGMYASVRFYDPLPTLHDTWISFGPTFEFTLFNHSNANLQGGVAFEATGEARFDLRLTVGLWKPKTKMVGMKAGTDR